MPAQCLKFARLAESHEEEIDVEVLPPLCLPCRSHVCNIGNSKWLTQCREYSGPKQTIHFELFRQLIYNNSDIYVT